MCSDSNLIAKKQYRLATSFLAVVFISNLGCGGGVQDKILKTPPPNPLVEACSMLSAYITNPAVGSEAMDFDDLVSRVSGVDADKGAKLEQLLNKAKQSGRVNQSAAKKLLAEFE